MKPIEDSDEVKRVVFINDKVILMYILGRLVGSFALRSTSKTQQAKPAACYWSVELFINQTT